MKSEISFTSRFAVPAALVGGWKTYIFYFIGTHIDGGEERGLFVTLGPELL